jgi:RHS repeat-associated protein
MAVIALVVATIATGALQGLSVPGGGTSKAGAAVTPLPTASQPHGGRVPPAASSTKSGSALSGGGVHPDTVVKGGCESWGSNYVATTYIHEAVTGGTVYGAWSATASGGVTAEKAGVVPFYGSLQSVTICPNYPVDSIAGTSDSKGYWMATSGGGVYAFGDAGYAGSRATGGFTTAIVAVVADPGTSGYWLVSKLGQVFAYGGAGYYGGSPSTLVTTHQYYGASVAAVAAAPTGRGYWMVTNYGVVYAYGTASIADFNDPGLGSTNYDWYTGVGPGAGGSGFWLTRMDGQTYAFDESWFGNASLSSGGDYFVSTAGTTNEGGYILMNVSGQNYAYGDAQHSTNPPYVPPPPPPPPPPPAGSTTEQVAGSGNPITNYTEPCAGDPVNCESGDLWQTDTDVTVPGPGPHLDLTRTYNSQAAKTKGIFGDGWSSSYAMSVAVTPTASTTVTEGDGSTVTFYTNTTGVFVAPTGTLATLVRNATGGYTFRVRNTTTYVFNADGRLVAENNPLGLKTTLTDNTAGQLTKVTDQTGRSIQFAYNASGFVSSVKNPAGQTTSYGYTGTNLISVTDPAGRITHYTYNATHRMVTETSPTGGVTTTHYNTAGQVTKQTDPTGLVTTWAYTGTNTKTFGTTTITGPTGSVTREIFTNGQMLTKITADGTPSAATWRYTYTSTTFGQTSVTDPDGNASTTTYNATGDVTSTTETLGNKTTTTYNSFNEPLVTVDPMGITTTDTYDIYGDLVKKVVTADSVCKSNCTQTTTYAVCTKITCTEFPFLWYGGEVETTVDPLGRKTVDLYDTYGNPYATLRSVTGKTEVTKYHYNILGEKTCESTPAAYAQGYRCSGTTRVAGTTSWTYDADGEVILQTNALTQTTSTGYDVAHGPADCTAAIAGAAYCTVTNSPSGDVTATYYDQDGRQVGQVAGVGPPTETTTTTAYDVKPGTGSCATGVATATNCQVTTNGNGQATVTYLNAATRDIKTVAPGNEVTTATYDGTGHPLTTTTAAGITTDGYDKDGRLTSVSYSGTASGYSKPTNVSYTYNADSQQTKMTDGTGTTSTTYNGWGLVSSTHNGAGESVGYGYDADNEVTTLIYTDLKTVHRTYNAAGQMTSTTDLAGKKTTFGYSLTEPPGVPGGAAMTTTTPGGETETTVDNALGQPVTTSVTNTATAWTTAALSGTGAPSATSCPTTAFCAMVEGKKVWISTNPTGGASAWTSTTLPATTGTVTALTGIACPSTTLCVATGTTGALFTSTNPTGGASAWTKTTVGARRAMSVSCPSTTLCVAVAYKSGAILTSTHPAGGASAWTTAKVTGAHFTAVNCPTTTLCVAGTQAGKLYTSTNPTGGASAWTSPWATSVATLAISAISCVSTSLCVAVTVTGDLTKTLNNLAKAQHVYVATAPTSSAWSSYVLGGPDGGANGVACPSTTFCVATGNTGREWTTTTPTAGHVNGTVKVATWANLQVTASDASGVACPSVTFCVAGEWKSAGILTMTASTHSVRSSAAYGTNDLLSTSSMVVGSTTTNATYHYDPQGQVTSSTMTGVPGATGSYTYDGGGDPTKVISPLGTPTTQTFSSSDEVKTAVTHSGTATYTYDSLGDRITAAPAIGYSATYSYSQTAELTGMSVGTSSGTNTAAYTYNGNGLRTSAADVIGSTHVTQHFTWDTQTSTPEMLSDGSRYFIYGPTGQVIEQENETLTLKNPLYLVHNALGSTVASISSTHVLSTETYNAYGDVAGHSGPNTTPIGFAGGYTDLLTGFLYLVNRYYDPTTGQFLSVDPDVAATHQPYEYANDNPANLTDPSGDDCGGGPTTPTALANFAAAYSGYQLEAYSQAVAGYQLEEFAATVSAFKAREFVVNCLALFCTIVPGVGVGPGTATPIPGRTAKPLPKSPPGKSAPAPKGTTANPFGSFFQPPPTPWSGAEALGVSILGILGGLFTPGDDPLAFL